MPSITNRIVESAELVINVLGSFGCHAQADKSATCPLKALLVILPYINTVDVRSILHIANVRIPFNVLHSGKKKNTNQNEGLDIRKDTGHRNSKEEITHFSSPSRSYNLAWLVPDMHKNWSPAFEYFRSWT